MKTLATLALCTLCCAAFADTKPFLGWKCTDVAALKAAAADPDVNAYNAVHRITFELMAAEITQPDTLKTLKDFEQVVTAAISKYEAADELYAKQLDGQSAQKLVLQYLRCRNDNRFLKDIMGDKQYTDLDYYREYYVVDRVVPVSDEEVRTAILVSLAKAAKAGNSLRVMALVVRYIDWSMDMDDDVVVKDLKRFYRITLPKLTGASNDPWKPIVAKIQLALKSRGVEIK